jgi:hypothetical protein
MTNLIENQEHFSHHISTPITHSNTTNYGVETILSESASNSLTDADQRKRDCSAG